MSALPPLQPATMVVSDFSAHLDDVRNNFVPNSQDVALEGLIDWHVAFMCLPLTKGELALVTCTVVVTISFILGQLFISFWCCILMTSSDILRIIYSIHLAVYVAPEVNSVKLWGGVPQKPRICWSKVAEDSHAKEYHTVTAGMIRPPIRY